MGLVRAAQGAFGRGRPTWRSAPCPTLGGRTIGVPPVDRTLIYAAPHIEHVVKHPERVFDRLQGAADPKVGCHQALRVSSHRGLSRPGSLLGRIGRHPPQGRTNLLAGVRDARLHEARHPAATILLA